MARIYISPSTQDSNDYWDGSTNEETQMRAICALVVPHLEAAGHTVKLGGSASAYSNMAESDDWKADIHVAVHSDAGGGDGTTAFYYSGSPESKKLCQCVYDAVAPLSIGADNGIRSNDGLVELNSTNAIATLIELAFHDRTDEGTQLKTQHEAFALDLAQGILNYAGGGVIYRIPEEPVPVEPKKLVGAHLHSQNDNSAAQYVSIEKDGDHVRIVSAIRGLCLEAMDGISDRRAPVRFGERVDGEGKERQLWRLVELKPIDGYGMFYEIESALNMLYVLDVVNGSTESGAGLQICERNTTPAQYFLILRVQGTNKWRIVNQKSLLPVDMDNAGN